MNPDIEEEISEHPWDPQQGVALEDEEEDE